jgi:hypothetical protein
MADRDLPEQSGGNLVLMGRVAARWLLEELEAGEDATEAIALLDAVFPADPPESYDPRPWIAAQEWVTARTPDNPHEYVVLRRSTDWRTQLVVLRWLWLGARERWRDGRTYRYRTVDGFRYWHLGLNDTIVNRERLPESQRGLWDPA